MSGSPWAGVMPATLCPFRDDDSIDEEGLRSYVSYLASVPGITALVCNGHTGEVMSLRNRERAFVTRVLAETVGARSPRPQVKVVSGVCAEGSDEAIDQALAAKEVGADAILLMPPHHWLRFGRTSETVLGFFQDVAEGAEIDIIVHQYPAWTKAGYSLAEMLEMVKMPHVVCIKMGTRDMARWGYDYRRLKVAAPHVPIVSCHDEYLLATLLDGCDGALVGFARVCARADCGAGAHGVGGRPERGLRGADQDPAAGPDRLPLRRAVQRRAPAHEVRHDADGQVPLDAHAPADPAAQAGRNRAHPTRAV